MKGTSELTYIDLDHAQKLLGDIKCERGLYCVTSGLQKLCKAWDVGSDFYLICLEKDKHCQFAISVEYAYLCKCPVRIYISKKYKR